MSMSKKKCQNCIALEVWSTRGIDRKYVCKRTSRKTTRHYCCEHFKQRNARPVKPVKSSERNGAL